LKKTRSEAVQILELDLKKAETDSARERKAFPENFSKLKPVRKTRPTFNTGWASFLKSFEVFSYRITNTPRPTNVGAGAGASRFRGGPAAARPPLQSGPGPRPQAGAEGGVDGRLLDKPNKLKPQKNPKKPKKINNVKQKIVFLCIH